MLKREIKKFFEIIETGSETYPFALTDVITHKWYSVSDNMVEINSDRRYLVNICRAFLDETNMQITEIVMKISEFSTLDDADTDDSSESVEDRIRSLIENETADNVLSDAKIAECLEKEGITIDRRVVGKHRAAMGIPSATDRQKKI